MKKKILFALTIPLMASMIAAGILVASSGKGGFSGVVDFKQLATVPESEWINSILQSSNSKYYEGMSVPQRVIFLDIASTPGNVHTLTFSHEATKGGIHAYDWLTAWNQGNDPPLVFVPWGPKIGPPKNLGQICQNLHTGPNCLLVDVPDDPFISKDGSTQDRINAYELEFGDRRIRICGNKQITSALFTAIYHDVPGGGDTGDSYIHYVLTWTSASDQILIEMAGHLAMSGDPATYPIAWGPGLGSSQIQGGPYHFKLYELDQLSLGSQDNQIMGAAILMVPGKKGGYKWDDKDGDGIWDTMEPALDGWTIKLFKWDGAKWVWQANAVTGAGDWPDGYYEFSGLEPGDYKVNETLPAGWICTCPGPSAAYEFTVTSGFEDLDNNFGNFKLGVKGGYKYEDITGDGPSADDKPLKDWTINLYKWDGAKWVFQTSKLTDDFGYYEFTGLKAGIYRVNETLKDGWICTHPSPSLWHEFTVTSGFSDKDNNFYNYKPGVKGGYKYDDVNGDGPAGTNIPLKDWTINLYKWDGAKWVFQTSKLTDPTGYYEFTGLEPGKYKVNETLQDGWICTYPSPAYYEFTVESGFVDKDNNFYNFKLGVKGGYKYNDKDGDGTAGTNTPLKGWTINLYKWDGAKWVFQESKVTDDFGYYEFKDLMPGKYKVNETLQAGWICISPDPAEYVFIVTNGFSDKDNNFYNFKLGIKAGYKWNDLDGDGVKEDGEPVLNGWTIKLFKLVGTDWVWQADAITGDGLWPDGYYEFTDLEAGTYRVQEMLQTGWMQTYPAGYHQFTVVSGFEDLDNNFGNFKLGKKGGYKWDDKNGDGLWDTLTEPALDGWTIMLYKLVGTSWVWQAQAVTGDGAWPNGYYEFAGLESGTYRVMEVLQTGWKQTYPAAGYHEFTVVSGFEELSNNFGNFKLGKKAGYKWNDLDGDGFWDIGEPGLPGWTIQLWKDGVLIDTDVTDANGYYEFNGLMYGEYRIKEVLQNGWICTHPDPPHEYTFTCASGFEELDNNFGNFKLGVKRGYKYDDVDGDGPAGINNPLKDWTINLYKWDGAKWVFQTSKLTDASGYYEFKDLMPGKYKVNETLQAGWTCTYPDPPYYEFTVTSGFSETNNNFYNFKLGIKAGYKWNDLDGDGVKEDGEPFLNGWTIQLYRWDGTTWVWQANAVTGDGIWPDGYYEFTDLEADTYRVQEMLQTGWMQTYPASGYHQFTVVSGFEDLDNNFGNFKPPEHPPSFGFGCVPITGGVYVGETKTFTFIVTNVGDPESRVYYLTLTAVIEDYTRLQFVAPYTASIRIYYNDGTFWSAYINGVLTCEKFAGFSLARDYYMVTWRVPTTYPDGPYLEGNDGGALAARLEIRFLVKGIAEGTTSLQMFPRATEDHHMNGVHLADINDKANIWGNDLWYPVHNSYDPYDTAAGTGHSWKAGWEPLPTTTQYARATKLVYILTRTTSTTTATATTGKTEIKEY